MNKHRRPACGLTLVEVLVALSLITIAVLALMAIFLAGTRMMRQATDVTMATDVGREFLETVKYDGYYKLSTGHYDGRVPDPQDATTQFPRGPYPSIKRGSQEYFLLVDVTDESAQNRLVKVQVYWADTHHITLATMVRQ